MIQQQKHGFERAGEGFPWSRSFLIDPVFCPRCHGTGVYHHPFNECESVDCADCDGSGFIENLDSFPVGVGEGVSWPL